MHMFSDVRHTCHQSQSEKIDSPLLQAESNPLQGPGIGTYESLLQCIPKPYIHTCGDCYIVYSLAQSCCPSLMSRPEPSTLIVSEEAVSLLAV